MDEREEYWGFRHVLLLSLLPSRTQVQQGDRQSADEPSRGESSVMDDKEASGEGWGVIITILRVQRNLKRKGIPGRGTSLCKGSEE